MSDLIRREDAIKAMEQRYQDILRLFKRKVKDGEKAIVLDMIGCIKTLPSAYRPQEWIPCSERLPKQERATYLICTDDGYICSCRWTNTNPIWTDLTTEWHWCIFDIPQYSKVVVWMDLKPWKGADDDSKRD